MTTLFSNNALTTLAVAAASGDTVLQVNDASKFNSSASVSNPQVGTISDSLFTVFEVVRITGVNTSTTPHQLTVVRSQENTVAQPTWSVGSNVFAAATAGVMNLFPQMASPATISGLWNFTTAPTISGSQIWTAANISPAKKNTTDTITGSWTFNALPNFFDGTSTFQFLTTKGGTLAGPLLLAADPTATNGAATKQYVDNTARGLAPRQSVRAASTGSNINISSAPTTLDGVTLVNGDSILLKDQTTQTQNVVYTFNGAGSALTARSDFSGAVPTPAGTQGVSVFVTSGTINTNSTWSVTTNQTTGNWGDQNLSWTQTGGAALIQQGNGILISSNTISVAVNTTTNNLVSNSSGVDLNTVSGLTPNTGTGLSSGGSGGYNNFTVDAFGRINAAATAPYALTTGATFSGTLLRTSAPSSSTPNDVTTVQYVSTQISTYVLTKAPTAAVATSNITLSGLQTIDGYSVQSGDRVLTVGQTNAADNGPWVASSGSWTRVGASDGLSYGAVWSVINGTANGGSLWMLATPGAISPGVTNLTIVRINGLGQVNSPSNTSGGLSLVGNTISLYQTGVVAGTYNAATITVDAYGRITSAANNVSGVASVFGRTGTVVAQNNDYTFAQIGSKPTTVSGYGITNPIMMTDGSTNFTSTVTSTLSGIAALYSMLNGAGASTDSTPQFQIFRASNLTYQLRAFGTSGAPPICVLDIRNFSNFTVNGATVFTSANFNVWTPFVFTSLNTTATATNRSNWQADTSSFAGTIVLPTNPNQGDTVRILDAARTFGTNNLTVSRNGQPIAGVAQDLVLSTNGQGVELVFYNSTQGWNVWFNY